MAARQETAAIRAALAPLVRSGHVRLEVLASATPAGLHKRLSGGGVDVLHFVGHGAFDEKEKSGSLFLVDARGRALAVDTDRVLRLLVGRGLKLVVLNACETGRGGRTDFLRGVAPALLAGGVPAVLANQYKVLDSSATAFARHLYWALAKGHTLGAAAREARVAVSYAKGAEPMDWAVPVLYARDTSLVFRGVPRAALRNPPDLDHAEKGILLPLFPRPQTRERRRSPRPPGPPQSAGGGGNYPPLSNICSRVRSAPSSFRAAGR